MAYRYTLQPNATPADVLDSIEAAVVSYMAGTRHIDEQAMRKLLDTDTEVRASYSRKIQREIDGLFKRGADPKMFQMSSAGLDRAMNLKARRLAGYVKSYLEEMGPIFIDQQMLTSGQAYLPYGCEPVF